MIEQERVFLTVRKSSEGLSADAEDAECLLTARRDNYVARTFSHMARARLDHAVSRSADLELLESEKWEMRCAHDPCLSMTVCLSSPMHG